jgi:hypothetical protein
LLLCLALTISAYAKLKPVNELCGVKLGSTPDEVKEVLGEPTSSNQEEMCYENKDECEIVYISLNKDQNK